MEKHLKAASAVAHLLDSKFGFGPFKFGLDPILGLIPGIGDFIGFVFSLYLVWIGKKMNLPQNLQNKMVRNLVLDLIIGSVPIIGDLADFVIRSNEKNLKILREHSSQV